MKCFLLLITALAFWSSGQAARGYKGYIVTLAGDTEQVFIKPPIGETEQREVVVVDSSGKKIRTYQAGELKAYGFDRVVRQFGGHPDLTTRHRYRQFLTSDSLPILAKTLIVGPKVDIHFSHLHMEDLKQMLNDFFNDDPNVLAEITKTSPGWSWAFINAEIADLLRIYNGQ